MCPVHLYAVTNDKVTFTKGEDKLVTKNGNGSLRFHRCSDCGVPVCQGPESANFRAFYPRYFDGYIEGKSNILPANLKP